MATNKSAVMTYLDPVIYQRLVVFKEQQNLRSLSKAIELILGEYFGIAASHFSSDDSHLLNRNVLKQNELLTETIERLTDVIESQTDLYRQLQMFQILKLSISEQLTNQQEDKSRQDSVPDPLLNKAFEQYLHAVDLSFDVAQQGLTGVKLAARLQVSASALSRRRSSPSFIEWSGRVDPQGVGWKFLGATRRFHPIVDYKQVGQVDSWAEVGQVIES